MCISPKPCVHLLTYTPFSVGLDLLCYMFWTQILDECTLFAYIHMYISLDIVHMYMCAHVHLTSRQLYVSLCTSKRVHMYICKHELKIGLSRLVNIIRKQPKAQTELIQVTHHRNDN